MQQKEQLINPITGEPADEIIKEREARQRGYLDFEFMLRYLEDESEFVKYFIIDGKKIVVDLDRPNLQYRKPLSINHERVLQTSPKESPNNNVSSTTAPTCDISSKDDTCLSCSG